MAAGRGAFPGRTAAAAADRLNCRVAVDDSVVSFFDSSNAYNLRLYADGEDEPFLVAGRAETDLNAARFALRRPIYRLHLYDVDLPLRFHRPRQLPTPTHPNPPAPPPPPLPAPHA